MPTHGEVRHHGTQSVASEITEFVDPKTGQTIVEGPMFGMTETVAETWCEHCQAWIQTNGVMGPLRFMADHRDGDCKKKP